MGEDYWVNNVLKVKPDLTPQEREELRALVKQMIENGKRARVVVEFIDETEKRLKEIPSFEELASSDDKVPPLAKERVMLLLELRRAKEIGADLMEDFPPMVKKYDAYFD